MVDYDGCIVGIVVIVEEGKFQVVVDDHQFEFHVMRLIRTINTLIWLLLFFGFNTTGLRFILFGWNRLLFFGWWVHNIIIFNFADVTWTRKLLSSKLMIFNNKAKRRNTKKLWYVLFLSLENLQVQLKSRLSELDEWRFRSRISIQLIQRTWNKQHPGWRTTQRIRRIIVIVARKILGNGRWEK